MFFVIGPKSTLPQNLALNTVCNWKTSGIALFCLLWKSHSSTLNDAALLCLRSAAKTCGFLKQVCTGFYLCFYFIWHFLYVCLFFCPAFFLYLLFLTSLLLLYFSFSVEKPPAPSRVQLVRASTATLEVCWGTVPTGMFSLLTVCVFLTYLQKRTSLDTISLLINVTKCPLKSKRKPSRCNFRVSVCVRVSIRVCCLSPWGEELSFTLRISCQKWRWSLRERRGDTMCRLLKAASVSMSAFLDTTPQKL